MGFLTGAYALATEDDDNHNTGDILVEVIMHDESTSTWHAEGEVVTGTVYTLHDKGVRGTETPTTHLELAHFLTTDESDPTQDPAFVGFVEAPVLLKNADTFSPGTWMHHGGGYVPALRLWNSVGGPVVWMPSWPLKSTQGCLRRVGVGTKWVKRLPTVLYEMDDSYNAEPTYMHVGTTTLLTKDINDDHHIQILPSDGTGDPVWIKHNTTAVVDFNKAEVRELETIPSDDGRSTSPLTTTFTIKTLHKTAASLLEASVRCKNAASCYHVSHPKPVRRDSYYLTGEDEDLVVILADVRDLNSGAAFPQHSYSSDALYPTVLAPADAQTNNYWTTAAVVAHPPIPPHENRPTPSSADPKDKPHWWVAFPVGEQRRLARVGLPAIRQLHDPKPPDSVVDYVSRVEILDPNTGGVYAGLYFPLTNQDSTFINDRKTGKICPDGVRLSDAATTDLTAQTTTIQHVHNTDVLEGSVDTDDDTASAIVDSPDATIRMMQFEKNDAVEYFPHASVETTALWHETKFVGWKVAEDGIDDWWSTTLDMGTKYSKTYNCPRELQGNVFFMRHAGTITKHKDKLYNDFDFPAEFYASGTLAEDRDDTSSKNPDDTQKSTAEFSEAESPSPHHLQQLFDRCKRQLSKADYNEILKLNASFKEPILVCDDLTHLFLRNLQPSSLWDKNGAFPSFLFVGSCCLFPPFPPLYNHSLATEYAYDRTILDRTLNEDDASKAFLEESGPVEDDYFKIGIGLSFGYFNGYGLYAIKDIPPLADSQCRDLQYVIGGITIDARKMVTEKVTHDDLQNWAREVRTYGTFPKKTASF